MMIPSELVIITNFTTITNLGMRNTFLGLILPSVTSVFCIYLLKEKQHGSGPVVSPEVSQVYPLVPPLATPAMTLRRKIRNSRIRGTEITTTAAIIAGMFSRPKPFSRIS